MFSFLAARGGFSRLPILLFLTGFLAGGCTDAGSRNEKEPAPLIRVGDVTIGAGEFNRAFEMAMTAYPYEIVKQPRALRAARELVLRELVERAVLAARARELAIEVTPAELSDAIARIRKGYPEGAFEQTLLESAVSYEAWKAALRRRLLMEKVVTRELESRISATDAEIRAYYRDHYAGGAEPPADLHPDIRKAIARRLRAEKMETAYGAWLENLKKTYPIEIDPAEWRRIAGDEPETAEGGPPDDNADEEKPNGERPNG
jgi:hypothetical protein